MDTSTKPRFQFRLRVYRDASIAIGPGKIALLEAILEAGSITAAAQQMGMSYRRAWLLVDELNRSLREPAVESAAGGARGGGTVVTDAGRELIRRYRSIEATARSAAAEDIAAMASMLVD
ncbi:LysR family transcriptional regulator [Pigmentiphaga sp. GD03639]|uniref:Winged helix-turn-helix domain-containing protein n=1 Tax=Pigmentiphaga daeguensis TaxID=414049 RepID=A0ABP3LZC1_9BURK|nr:MULTISPECIES: LysR family transcriptional regulator [unclassified Pigmentiphaga]MDH2237285.1 LysR family transcriptional regulator [Pigmentiphaga sp. GD03639]OVZ61121.1 ModE family transcriptional regulator [Pigmentiphaga sp. NML030171]